jgi:hypothetical protein
LWGLSGWRGNERIADSIKKGPPGARAGGGCCSGSDRAPNFQGSAGRERNPVRGLAQLASLWLIACPASKLSPSGRSFATSTRATGGSAETVPSSSRRALPGRKLQLPILSFPLQPLRPHDARTRARSRNRSRLRGVDEIPQGSELRLIQINVALIFQIHLHGRLTAGSCFNYQELCHRGPY